MEQEYSDTKEYKMILIATEKYLDYRLIHPGRATIFLSSQCTIEIQQERVLNRALFLKHFTAYGVMDLLMESPRKARKNVTTMLDYLKRHWDKEYITCTVKSNTKASPPTTKKK